MGLARNALIKEGMHNEAVEMNEAVTHCKSYDEALVKIGEYVEIE